MTRSSLVYGLAIGVGVVAVVGIGTVIYLLRSGERIDRPSPTSLQAEGSKSGRPREGEKGSGVGPASIAPPVATPEPQASAAPPVVAQAPPATDHDGSPQTPKTQAEPVIGPTAAAPVVTPSLPAGPQSLPGSATLPQSPPTQSSAKIDRAEQISHFIDQYDGGDCFFVAPISVSENSASIEGYGSIVEPFQALGDAFKRANGFEANIGQRQITSAQCPAITFLGRVRKIRGAAPHLTIADSNPRRGRSLTGSIGRHGGDHIELLLVADDGVVSNLSGSLKPGSDGDSFNIPMPAGAAAAKPQLLLVVASALPLSSLKRGKPTAAEILFPLAVAEATRTAQRIGVTAKLIKPEK